MLSTCNRIEIYTDVDRFHGSVESISRLLGELAGQSPDDVLAHLYVHYDDGAVSHLFHVAAGLDSMVVGESQILGQTREALRVGQEHGTVGPALNVLFQQALRVGKRSHAETDIDRVAPSLVVSALDRAADHVGELAGKHVVIVGAGSMAGLTAATAVARRRRLDHRRQPHAGARHPPRRAVRRHGDPALRPGDVHRPGRRARLLHRRHRRRDRRSRRSPRAAATTGPLAVVDLALPHDVDPEVGRPPRRTPDRPGHPGRRARGQPRRRRRRGRRARSSRRSWPPSSPPAAARA